MYRILILVILLSSCQPKSDLPVTIDLSQGWEFKQQQDSVWRSASVPGNVFSDLLAHQLIPDPFIGNNEHEVQWVSQSNWEYRTNFSIDQELLQKKHLRLDFNGLDTYAKVYLNDSLILEANNAFRHFKVAIKPLIKANNTLRILFESTSINEEKEAVKLGYALPEGPRVFTRKAQFQYGWDWGPKLNTMGIWRDIKLIAYNDFKIEDLYFNHLSLSDSVAHFSVNLEVNQPYPNDLTYEVLINDSIKTSPKSSIPYRISLPVELQNPKLWWPHNIGEPYRYDLKVIVKDGNKILDSLSKPIGLRTINLITEQDSIGESFYFKVNNIPVYAKGANYIPQHSFQDQVKASDYERLLSDVVEANMNMLRVWGGGIYENDIFYQLCDQKGILVWQDFMFACAMYPGDPNFLNTVQQEAIDNVKRLRNHPSIALWCGNNESSEGWHRWGWQANRSEDEKAAIWNNYLKVFDSILPRTVAQFSTTDYWESSPKFGRGNPQYEFEGDAHDWWIWHDAYPFEHLEEHVPRFMSEFGFQSFPSEEVINFINQSDSLNITSEGFKNHQKHHRGFELIDTYMKRDFPVPDSAEDYVYMSQLLQAYGITKGIEAHRRAKPRNMGTLYWQLNDCWPAVSWSSIDFSGQWKALHYKVKKAFENLLISSSIEDNILTTYAVSDFYQAAVPLELIVTLSDFDGNIIWNKYIEPEAKANSVTEIQTIDLNTINFDPKNTVLVIARSESTSKWLHYFAKPKDLKLKKEDIETRVTRTAKGFEIELQARTLQKDVFLYTSEKGRFSNNYFDLLPGETRTIEFVTNTESLDDLQLKTLNQFVD